MSEDIKFYILMLVVAGTPTVACMIDSFINRYK